ncbi:MAG: DUF3566 domain-containing protein [Nitriliruptorales bacterium]|nr:DUF3566 domain-containing protein [Nitriliruptorales bacterium]
MVRRRLTLKRVDPWSVLKFGFVLNLALLAIWMLAAGVMWFFIQRLQLIDKVCSIATDMGFVECGINGGNLFRALFLLGLLGVVVNTGLFVFFAFLQNLIADLVGGLQFGFDDDTPGAAARGEVSRTSGSVTGRQQPVPAATGASSSGGSERSRSQQQSGAASSERQQTSGSDSSATRPVSSDSWSGSEATGDRIFGDREQAGSGQERSGGQDRDTQQ